MMLFVHSRSGDGGRCLRTANQGIHWQFIFRHFFGIFVLVCSEQCATFIGNLIRAVHVCVHVPPQLLERCVRCAAHSGLLGGPTGVLPRAFAFRVQSSCQLYNGMRESNG